MFGYFTFKVLPAVLLVAYILYIAYIRANPKRLKEKQKKIAKKYKGTPFIESMMNLYSSKYYEAWILITVSFVLGIVFDLFRNFYRLAATIVFLISIVGLASLLAGSFMLAGLFPKSRRR